MVVKCEMGFQNLATVEYIYDHFKYATLEIISFQEKGTENIMRGCQVAIKNQESPTQQGREPLHSSVLLVGWFVCCFW